MRDIDVRYEPVHDAPAMVDGRPMLTWGRDPVHGPGWTLVYLDETDGVEDHFIPGDLLDVDHAVRLASDWLDRRFP